jgi:alkylation response protein AidB-like acyl-CoA dehydrogenase
MSAAARAGADRNVTLNEALDWVAATAGERDAEPVPRFPEPAIARLEAAGALGANADADAASELGLVRRIAAADGGVGRIVDGHLNAIERMAVQGTAEVREHELAELRAGRLRAGVWGADPVPGEGPPAAVVGGVLRGVKTFCSGAGGLDRALVLARGEEPGPPLAVWLDVADRVRVEVDESWFKGAGLRASVSHRVVFHDAPVLAQFGGPGALSEQPWFSRDALRTAASWAGMADSAAHGALDTLAARPSLGPLEELAAGRILGLIETISAWLERAANAMDSGDPSLPALSVHARVAIADAARALLDEAARACGSRPFATGGRLDRARRDLQLFMLQHRLEPMLARTGAAALEERR